MDWFLVADPEPLFREGLGLLLGKMAPGKDVVFCDSQAAVLSVLAARGSPALLVCSAALPGVGGLGGLEAYLAKDPALRVVVILNDCENQRFLEVLLAGARGVIGRRAERRILQLALSLVRAGGTYLPSRSLRELVLASPQIRDRSLERIAHPEIADPKQDMTPRQRQVLRCLVRGMSNKLIARELELELATVKTHVHRVFHKLGVGNRTQAALKGRGLGLGARGTPSA